MCLLTVLSVLSDYGYIIKPLITYFPTILFSIIVLGSMISGFRRGLRKSTILFINMIIAFAVAAAIFFALTSNASAMDNLLGSTNNILNSAMGKTIQDIIKVPNSETTVMGILEYFVKSKFQNELIGIAFSDAQAYISTIVMGVFSIIAFIICIIIYWIMKFLLYVIYLIFFKEGRYKKKKRKAYANELSERPYKRRRLLGTLVGTVRGSIMGIVAMSFIGVFAAIISGGIEVKTTNADNFGYGEYQEIIDYVNIIQNVGNEGILKILGQVKDSNDVPYYFLFADQVLKGRLNDPELGIDQDIYLREELGGYFNLLNQFLNLSDKYDFSGVVNSVQTGNQDVIIDALIELFETEGFKDDFKYIIGNYTSPIFTTNLVIHMIDSIVTRYEEYAEALGMGLDNPIIGLIPVLFKSENGIKPSEIFSDSDVRLIIQLIADIVPAAKSITSEFELDVVIKTISDIYPSLNRLSIFTNNQKHTRVNQIMGELVNYVCETYIEDFKGEIDFTVVEIDWVNDIYNIGTLIYNLDQLAPYINLEDLYSVIDIFDKNNEIYATSRVYLDNLVKVISKSTLVNMVLDTDYFHNKITETISTFAGTTIELPRTIQWVQTYDNVGNVVIYGDIAYLIDFLASAATAGVREVLETEGNDQIIAIKDLILALDESEGTEESEILKLMNIDIVYYIISSFILNYELELMDVQTKIFVLDSQKSIVENVVVVDRNELKQVVSLLGYMAKNFIPADGNMENMDLFSLLTEDAVETLFTSKIMEATFSKIAYQYLSTDEFADLLYVPMHLRIKEDGTNIEAWLSTDTKDGEIKKICKSVLSTGLMDKLKEDNADIVSIVLSLTDTELSDMLESDLISYSISNILSDFSLGDDLSIIVPMLTYGPQLENETVRVIDNNEVLTMIRAVRVIFDYDPLDENSTLDLNGFDPTVILDFSSEKIDQIIESKILHATICNYAYDLLTTKEELIDFISMPTEYNDVDTLVTDFNNNMWIVNLEIKNLFNAISILEIDINNPDSIDTSSIVASLSNPVGENPNILNIDKVCESYIMWSSLSNIMLSDEYPIVVPNIVLFTNNDNYIIKDELKSLVIAIKEIDIDFEDLSSINVSNFIGNETKINAIISSDILHATILVQLDELVFNPISEENGIENDNLIKVPTEYAIVKDDIISDFTNNNWYIELELRKLLMGIDALGVEFNDNTPSFDTNLIFSLNDLYNEDGTETKIDVLCHSIILYYTFSDILINQDQIYVPEVATINSVTNNMEIYIKKTELIKLISSLNALEISTIEELGNEFDFSDVINDDQKLNRVIASIILEASISKIIEGLLIENDQTILPDELKLGANIDDNMSSWISTYNESDVLVSGGELRKLLRSSKELGITEFMGGENSSMDFSMETLFTKSRSEFEIITDSKIIHASIADTILDLTDTGGSLEDTLILPIQYKNQRASLETDFDNSIIITDNVVISLIMGAKAMELEFDGNSTEIDLDIVKTLNDLGDPNVRINSSDTKLDIILNSKILWLTMSNKIIDVEALKVPTEIIVHTNFELSENIIKKDEFVNLINAINELGININGDIDTFALTSGFIETFNNSNYSKIMQATISNTLLESDNTTMVIPDSTLLSAMNVKTLLGIEVIKAEDLYALLQTFDGLGFSNLSADSDITIIVNEEAVTVIDRYESIIIQATISKNIIENLVCIDSVLEDITVSNVNKVMIDFEELIKLLNNLAVLGVSTDTNATLNINNDLITIFENENDLSIILQATVSQNILNSDSIIVPLIANNQIHDSVLINGTNQYIIVSSEIALLLNNLKALGISDTASMDIDNCGLTTMSTIFETDEVCSQIIRATVSKMLLDINSLVIYNNIYDTIDRIKLTSTLSNIKIIDRNEIYLLITSFGEDFDLENFSLDEISISDLIETFNKPEVSFILQATVSDKIAALNYHILSTSVIYEFNGSDINEDSLLYVVKNIEISKFLVALNTANFDLKEEMAPFTAQTLGELDETALDAFLDSEIGWAFISNSVEAINSSLGIFALTLDYVNVSCIAHNETINLVTINSIKDVYNRVNQL